MSKLKLLRPGPEHEQAANEFKREFFDAGEPVINGSALLDQMEYGEWLENTCRNADPAAVHQDWVRADTLFAMRESDGRLIGIIDIRHNLEHPFLAEYGGHIGYAVRPSERRRGYAVQMLRLGLAHAKSIGLPRVMLGCYADNEASYKTIEACGGVCTEEKPYADGKPMYIYWITL